MISIIGIWLLTGILLFLQGRNKQSEEKDDIMQHPLLIVAWPFMFFLVGPMIAIPLFGIIALLAYLFHALGIMAGYPLLGDSLLLFLYILLIVCLKVYFCKSKKTSNSDTNKLDL